MSGKVVGIDLGTSNSVVAAVVGGKPVVIPDEEGNRIHPSVVSFLPGGDVIVGAKASARKVIDPVNTIYSVKRLIGRPFHSQEVRVAQTHYPYTVVCGSDNNPKIQVQQQEYSPEEIAALVLRRMKHISERYLGQKVDRAVITVPANFNEAQRYATKAAGEIAGLDVLRILNEPTAAALAYGYGENRSECVAIYDFGGGTFDITILELRGTVFEVLSTAGDTYLGGDDFDNRLVDYMVAAFKHKHQYDLSQEVIALQRLKNIAERLKVELTRKEKVAVHIKEIIPGSPQPVTLSFSIAREGFNERCMDIVRKSFIVCDEAMRLAGLTTSHIDHVVLVGGSTKIPLVKDMVGQYFSRPPVGNVNPDEVVGVGAAIYGDSLDRRYDQSAGAPPPVPQTFAQTMVGGEPVGMMGPPPVPGSAGGFPAAPPPISGPPSGLPASIAPDVLAGPEDGTNIMIPSMNEQASAQNKDALLIDVTSRGLGIATAGGFCDLIIERNERIPTERKRIFTTSADNQEFVRIQVLEGESRRSEENSKLGELVLSGLRNAVRGEVRVEVTFEIDTDGILNVQALDVETQQRQRTTLNVSGGLRGADVAEAAARTQALEVHGDMPDVLP